MAALSTETQTAATLFPDIGARFTADQVAMIDRALVVTAKAHQNQNRRSGEPYVHHPIAVAQILYEMQMDATTICAGLLHDTIEDTGISEENLSEEFGPAVAGLVQGVTKIGKVGARGIRRRRIESLRKMILATARDVRVIIIKLADRLHNMRTLRWLPPKRRVDIAQDTMEVYAPLCSRLGMEQVKAELEDLSMRWMHPEAYEYVTAKIAKGKAQRERLVDRFVTFLSNLLEENSITVHELSGRPKHFWSIWSKMQRQDLSFEDVFDLLAIRIVTETIADCYDAIGVIHGQWKPVPNRFKDYIAVPRGGVYQALHTSVIGLGGEIVEVQIRTADMHKTAEMGIAAHWKYKEGGRHDHELEEKLQWLRGLANWIKDVQDPTELMDALESDVFADTVFCFTPRGDVMELPRGSTAIDFAYAVHTEVGHQCTGVRINKRMAPLRTELNNGDIVDIITTKNSHPSRSWLAHAKTNRARGKIRHWLRQANQVVNVTQGREAIHQALRGRQIKISIEEVQNRLTPHFEKLGVKTFGELLADVGFGAIHVNTIINLIMESEPRKPDTPRAKPPKSPPSGATIEGVRVAGVGNTVVRFAQCCSPIPGDSIQGFVTRGRGVTVHRSDCPGLRRLMSDPQSSGRVVQTSWDSDARPPRATEVRVVARDRHALLVDLTQAITERGIFIEGSRSRSNRNGTATLSFQLLVSSENQINAVMERLRKVQGVTEIKRVGPGVE